MSSLALTWGTSTPFGGERLDSNQRPLAHEANELPLLYSAFGIRDRIRTRIESVLEALAYPFGHTYFVFIQLLSIT